MGRLTRVGSNSSVTAPSAFSRTPLRVMSKTSDSVGSESLRMSHHRTWGDRQGTSSGRVGAGQLPWPWGQGGQGKLFWDVSTTPV